MSCASERQGGKSAAVASIEAKYKVFRQQLQTFTSALENGRLQAGNAQDHKIVRTISQIKGYAEKTGNAVDERILRQFLEVYREVAGLKSALEQDAAGLDLDPNDPDFQTFANTMSEWERMTSWDYDFGALRAHYPHSELNHLSCVEAREKFGGAVSIIPILMDMSNDSRRRLRSLQSKYPPVPVRESVAFSPRDFNQEPAEPYINNTNNNIPSNLNSAAAANKKGTKKWNGYKNLEKYLDQYALAREQEELRRQQEKQNRVGGWRPTGPWRGASKDKVNHVAHRY